MSHLNLYRQKWRTRPDYYYFCYVTFKILILCNKEF
nr:MAG TPA: hypothetical protein [Caudoviricetes sp.]